MSSASVTANAVRSVLFGLDVNTETILNQIEQFGLVDAARQFAHDATDCDLSKAAGRLLMLDHIQTNCEKSLIKYAKKLRHILNEETYRFIVLNAEALQREVDLRDRNNYRHDWFSASTMIELYLARAKYNHPPVETPQQMYLRVATQLYFDEGVDAVIQAYRGMSDGLYTHASPTLFNAGLKMPQMSSCFLTVMGDSTRTIQKACCDVMDISSRTGGIGIDVSQLRHGVIRHIGHSDGVVPQLAILEAIIKAYNQGGKRKGALSAFIRPHHIDVFDFLNTMDVEGDQTKKLYALKLGLWMEPLFLKRVKENGQWTLFNPTAVPKLDGVYGADYDRIYEEYENSTDPTILENKRVVPATKLMEYIVNVQRRTGGPYILNSAACNGKSNHKHLGYIRTSNLCCEIVEYCDSDTTAVCNLASISLRHHVGKRKDGKRFFDFEKYANTVRQVTRNLNKVIKNNYYPTEASRRGNETQLPIAIGVSGFADMLYKLDLSFEDPEVELLNKQIFACQYFNAMIESVQQSMQFSPYPTFEGSPLSQGKFQFDLWREESESMGITDEDDQPIDPTSWGQKTVELRSCHVEPTWESLREAVVTFGARNSLLCALMPTASTAQVLRNCESVEAHCQNIYCRSVLKGTYVVTNRHMVKDLKKLGLWNRDTVDFILACDGSVKWLDKWVSHLGMEVTPELKKVQRKYKTMFELSQKLFMKLAAQRGRYIDQTQSSNVFLVDPTNRQLQAVMNEGFRLRLKTVSYYIRTRPAVEPQKATVPREISEFADKVRGVSSPTDGASTQDQYVCLSCQ